MIPRKAIIVSTICVSVYSYGREPEAVFRVWIGVECKQMLCILMPELHQELKSNFWLIWVKTPGFPCLLVGKSKTHFSLIQLSMKCQVNPEPARAHSITQSSC